MNGLLARSFRAEIFGFRKSSVSESEFLDWNPFFFWLGENMYFSIRKCVFFVQVCVVISFGKSFVSNSKDRGDITINVAFFCLEVSPGF